MTTGDYVAGALLLALTLGAEEAVVEGAKEDHFAQHRSQPIRVEAGIPGTDRLSGIVENDGAAIAASLLARAGRRPVLVNGSYGDPETGAAAAGLHAVPATL